MLRVEFEGVAMSVAAMAAYFVSFEDSPAAESFEPSDYYVDCDNQCDFVSYSCPCPLCRVEVVAFLHYWNYSASHYAFDRFRILNIPAEMLMLRRSHLKANSFVAYRTSSVAVAEMIETDYNIVLDAYSFRPLIY